mmetsp:Transcript_13266/g.14706  ORF Transcript_13266/g.14706 Transcript_13266/m.14706 type:complete len:386 (-) Transcript_13266:53-1210(-)
MSSSSSTESKDSELSRSSSEYSSTEDEETDFQSAEQSFVDAGEEAAIETAPIRRRKMKTGKKAENTTQPSKKKKKSRDNMPAETIEMKALSSAEKKDVEDPDDDEESSSFEGSEEMAKTYVFEKHQKGLCGKIGEYIKSIVFGGLDGIITTFAVVASVSGAGLSVNLVLVFGFANLIADGLSMGVGDFLSERAEVKHAIQERKRELFETRNLAKHERKEMIDIYMDKGMKEKDATLIIDTMMQYEDIFVDTMMVEELGIMPPGGEKPIINGIVTFFSFLTFGVIPLLVYIAALGISGSRQAGIDGVFAIACACSFATLFFLGALSSFFGSTSWWAAGLFVSLNGAAAAGAAYLIGWGLEELVGEDPPEVLVQNCTMLMENTTLSM